MLRGEQVVLRSIERDDLKRLHKLQQNVELMLLGEGTWQPEPFAAYEKNFEKHLEDQDKAWFVIEVDGVVIGDIGLHHCQRRDSTTQFGIAIYDPEYLGQGYGRDALQTLLRWAFRVQNYRRVWLETHAINERAIRSYRACGFVEEGRLRKHTVYDGTYIDVLIMGLLRSEWEAGYAK